MKRSFKSILRLNYKTLYFNFKYLPFKQAIRLPFVVSRKLYFRKTNGKVLLEGPVYSGMIHIGTGDVAIFDNKKSRTIWDVSGTVVFHGKCHIGHGSKISVGESGTLIFGDQFSMTAESTIIAYKEVRFGRNCLLSWDILIMDTDLHKIKDKVGEELNGPQPISVGDHVWIGSRCLILKGSSIPDGCVIGANSTITKSLGTKDSIYIGSPAKCVREGITWDL